MGVSVGENCVMRPDGHYVVARASDVLEVEGFLRSWAETFAATDSLLLTILGNETDAAPVGARISALPDPAPPVAFVGVDPDTPAAQEWIAGALYFYGPRPLLGPLARVPRVDAGTLAIARFHLDDLRQPTTDYMTHGPHHPVDVTMGRHSYFADSPAPEFISYAFGGKVEVGSFCSVSNGVKFYMNGAHRMDTMTTSPLHNLGLPGPPGHAAGKGPIEIGNDVWIGHDASILFGVKIGTGAVIGACAVVASDVRPFAIVVGNPAREIRRRFADDECELLLESHWWDLDDDAIRALLPEIWSSDVRAFVTRVHVLRETADAGGMPAERIAGSGPSGGAPGLRRLLLRGRRPRNT